MSTAQLEKLWFYVFKTRQSAKYQTSAKLGKQLFLQESKKTRKTAQDVEETW